MSNLIKYLLPVVVIILLFATSAVADSDQNAKQCSASCQEDCQQDLPDISEVDPMDPSAGDFLDLDYGEFEQLGWEAYQAGEYETAAMYYLAYLQTHTDDSRNIYNLACCYGLLDEPELAAMYIERAVNAGYDDLDWISWDPDFDNVRESTVFSELMDRLYAEFEEAQAGQGETIYTQSSNWTTSCVQVPEDYDPDETYTLVVGLHGYGSSADSYVRLWERFEDRNFIFICPQAPYAFGSGTSLGYSWQTGDENIESIWPASVQMSSDYIMDVIDNARSLYNIDEVYTLGFSQGCFMSYITGIFNYEEIDGIICFGGWLDHEFLGPGALENAVDLRVFIAHGTEDTMVEYEAGITARDYLTDLGYDVTFVDFEGGHAVPEEPLQAAEDWMFE